MFLPPILSPETDEPGTFSAQELIEETKQRDQRESELRDVRTKLARETERADAAQMALVECNQEKRVLAARVSELEAQHTAAEGQKQQLPQQTLTPLANVVQGVENALSYRTAMADAIKSGKLQVDKCNLAGWMNNFNVLSKSSASATSVVLAQFKNAPRDSMQGASVKIGYAERKMNPKWKHFVEYTEDPESMQIVLGNHPKLQKKHLKMLFDWLEEMEDEMPSIKQFIPHAKQLVIDYLMQTRDLQLKNLQLLGICALLTFGRSQDPAGDVDFATAGTYKADEVVAMMEELSSFGATEPDNSLSVERGLYELFFDFILRHHFTPNVVSFIASFECTRDELEKHKLIPPAEGALLDELAGDRQLLNENTMIDLYSYTPERFQFLVIEKTQGVTLARLRLEGVWRSVLFQILYTFEVFNRLGLRHNDAHNYNIFIDDLRNTNAPTHAFYYVAPGVVFKVPLGVFVKIFDLDLGAITCDETTMNPKYHNTLLNPARAAGVCFNTRLQGEPFCPDYGLCNDRNEKFDAFTTLLYIRAKFKKGAVRKFIDDVIDPKLSQAYTSGEDLGFFARLGLPRNKGMDRSHVPTDKEMWPISKMLEHPFFNPLRANNEDVAAGCRQFPIYHQPLRPDESPDVWKTAFPANCLIP